MKNKVVIVTGAASGIGRAIADRCAREGAKVVVADNDESLGETVANDLQAAGHEALYVSCDVSERLDVRNLLAHTLEAYERVDVLINNAGILDHSTFLDLTDEEFDRVIAVNLKGYFLVGQAVARQMVTQIEGGGEAGSIVNMSSINQFFALPERVAYSVSKGGVQQLTKAMALALAPYGIRVNAIAPATVDTPLVKNAFSDADLRSQILSRTPLGRFGDPAEIAGIAVFLAGPDASFITGETVYADGGRRALNFTINLSENE